MSLKHLYWVLKIKQAKNSSKKSVYTKTRSLQGFQRIWIQSGARRKPQFARDSRYLDPMWSQRVG